MENFEQIYEDLREKEANELRKVILAYGVNENTKFFGDILKIKFTANEDIRIITRYKKDNIAQVVSVFVKLEDNSVIVEGMFQERKDTMIYADAIANGELAQICNYITEKEKTKNDNVVRLCKEISQKCKELSCILSDDIDLEEKFNDICDNGKYLQGDIAEDAIDYDCIAEDLTKKLSNNE